MQKSRSPEQILKSYPADVQAVADKARRLLLKLLPDAEETTDPSAPVLSYGYGPGYAGMICTLILSKSGVKLGLVRGTDLDDPSGLLEGSGKKHKYIQLNTAPTSIARASRSLSKQPMPRGSRGTDKGGELTLIR